MIIKMSSPISQRSGDFFIYFLIKDNKIICTSDVV